MDRVKLLAFAFASLVIAYLCGGIALYLFQRQLLYAADATTVHPRDVGLDHADVQSLTASDGVKLKSWFVPGSDRRIAIYFHGNGGSLAFRGETIGVLLQSGLSVLAVEYRGFGGSEGSPSEDGLARDADAAYDKVRTLGYASSQIVLVGESLGSGVAVALATRREVAGLVLDSAYSSIADVGAARYWMYPVRLLIADSFDSVARIASVAAPILLIHGTQDDVVPIRFGRKLFRSAGRNAKMVEVQGAGHLVLQETTAQRRLREWLKQLS